MRNFLFIEFDISLNKHAKISYALEIVKRIAY